jgi:hypothetical protein
MEPGPPHAGNAAGPDLPAKRSVSEGMRNGTRSTKHTNGTKPTRSNPETGFGDQDFSPKSLGNRV